MKDWISFYKTGGEGKLKKEEEKESFQDAALPTHGALHLQCCYLHRMTENI